MRKNLHVYFKDKKGVTIPVDVRDPICRFWPSSREVRKIIKAQTFQTACHLARRDDRTVRRYILHKVKKHLGLIPK